MPPQPNHDRFCSSGKGNGTSMAAMILRSLFCRVGLMGNTVAVMLMPYLPGVVWWETREGVYRRTIVQSPPPLRSSTAIRRPSSCDGIKMTRTALSMNLWKGLVRADVYKIVLKYVYINSLEVTIFTHYY